MAGIGSSTSNNSAPLMSVASLSPDDRNYNNDKNHQEDHDDQLLFSGDPNYALHGEIMLLVLVLLFILFLSCLLLFFYMKRRRGHLKQSSPEKFFPGNFPPSSSPPVHLQKAHVDSTGSKLQQRYEEFRLADYHQPPA